MGFLREKYTREYFLAEDKDGNKLDYGALGAKEWKNGDVFEDIKVSLDQVDYNDKKILEIGFGRCESGRYLLIQKNASFYFGIDFSDSAYELAQEALKDISEDKYELILDDALDFLSAKNFNDDFDVAIMLDTIEHIPTKEFKKLLPLIYKALKKKGYLIAHTPFYNVDEDFIAQGFEYIEPTFSDIKEETRGMHCNKFTRERFIKEITSAGYDYISDRLFQKG